MRKDIRGFRKTSKLKAFGKNSRTGKDVSAVKHSLKDY